MADDLELRLGELEYRFKLYEPILAGLPALASIPNELVQINTDLRALKDARIEAREKIITLIKEQGKGYNDILDKLAEKSALHIREVADCPIRDVVERVGKIEKELAAVDTLFARTKNVEDSISMAKMKGWELFFRVIPWIIATGVTIWALLRHPYP